MKLMPRSMAEWTRRMASASPTGVPKVIVPRQTGDTSSPLEPRGRYCMVLLLRPRRLVPLPGRQPGGVLARLGNEVHTGQANPRLPQAEEDRAGLAAADRLPLERGGVDEGVGGGGAEDLVGLHGLVAPQVALPDGEAQLAGQLHRRRPAD